MALHFRTIFTVNELHGHVGNNWKRANFIGIFSFSTGVNNKIFVLFYPWYVKWINTGDGLMEKSLAVYSIVLFSLAVELFRVNSFLRLLWFHPDVGLCLGFIRSQIHLLCSLTLLKQDVIRTSCQCKSVVNANLKCFTSGLSHSNSIDSKISVTARKFWLLLLWCHMLWNYQNHGLTGWSVTWCVFLVYSIFQFL